MTFFVSLSLLLAAACAPAPRPLEGLPEGRGTLVVTISGLHSLRGALLLSLFAGPDGFPDETARALVSRSLPLGDEPHTAVFTDLPFGEYALSLLHDENSDGEMNTTLLGIPVEGYGFSNDATGRFGPPGYAAARFVHATAETRLALRIHYVEPKRRGPGG